MRSPSLAPQTVAVAANSLSMPFLEQPKNLDGSMAGDVGFDPLGLSEIDDLGIDLYWLREAELKHGRVAMLAATGVIWVEAFGPLPAWPEADGRSQMDVFWDAWEEHPNAILAAVMFIAVGEVVSGIACSGNNHSRPSGTSTRRSQPAGSMDISVSTLRISASASRKRGIFHCDLANIGVHSS